MLSFHSGMQEKLKSVMGSMIKGNQYRHTGAMYTLLTRCVVLKG